MTKNWDLWNGLCVSEELGYTVAKRPYAQIFPVFLGELAKVCITHAVV